MTAAKKMTAAQIITSYEAGKSLREISAACGYTVEGVRQVLKRNGVELRAAGYYLRKERTETFADEMITDLPKFLEPITLDLLTDWFGADPEKVATTVKRLFLLGKLTIQVAP